MLENYPSGMLFLNQAFSLPLYRAGPLKILLRVEKGEKLRQIGREYGMSFDLDRF